jgi:hypothetical protein
VATARAEDPSPPASGGASATTGTDPGGTDASGTTGETGTTTGETGGSGTTGGTDTSGTTGGTDTSGTTGGTDTSGTAGGTDTSGTTGGTDTSGTTGGTGTTGETGTSGTTGGTETSGTSGGTATTGTSGTAETSGTSVVASSSPEPSPQPPQKQDSAPGTADPGATTPAPARVDDGDPVPSRGSFTPAVGGEGTLVAASRHHAPQARAVGRRVVECRTAGCGLPDPAGAAPGSKRLLFGPWSPLEAARDGRPAARTEGGRGPPQHAQPPTSPRLPAPNQPQGPTAPTSALWSGSSGGFQGGAVLGLIAALLSLMPRWTRRLVTPFERRRPALLLALSLERPG